MLKNGKTGNRNGQQKRKTDIKNGQNRKSQRPPLENMLVCIKTTQNEK